MVFLSIGAAGNVVRKGQVAGRMFPVVREEPVDAAASGREAVRP